MPSRSAAAVEQEVGQPTADDEPHTPESRLASPSASRPERSAPHGWYGVLGRNMHAWPEIWFDGIGWVPFGHPAARIPGAEGHTGVPAAQDVTVSDLGTPEPGGVTLPLAPPTRSTVRVDLDLTLLG